MNYFATALLLFQLASAGFARITERNPFQIYTIFDNRLV
jgi:hypothetical protein